MSTIQVMAKDDEVQTSIRFPRDLIRRAKKYAIDHDTSLAAIHVKALEEYLDKHK